MSAPPEPYLIEWAGPAQRAMQRLPDKLVGVVAEFVYGPFAGNPQQAGRPLRWELEGLHSARRGDYRIVYRVDESRRTVVVLAIGHRADVYRPR